MFTFSAVFACMLTLFQRVMPLGKNIQYRRINYEAGRTKLKD
jgi:hypothetical protein